MNIKKILSTAEQTCNDSGTRFTDKRKHVLSCLLESQKPLSAYDLVDDMRERYDESLPPMSIYRILEFLESENLVHKLSSTNKFIACSHIACEHSHQVPQFLICDRCGIVKEIGIHKDVATSLQNSVTAAGFFLQSPQLELHCLCSSCSTAGK
ncbi:transcriptional repressor [Teredinibacter haidensis]|uniref:transcriptional repressor n=1 Tax=Teredinibacter haidensis TaxID=2731755 RepID=UPI000948D9A4|nr:transcriptional repressor [Teredinibacter haidensis]